jgi:CubicO group peptidase (beta-lactamase class C family)
MKKHLLVLILLVLSFGKIQAQNFKTQVAKAETGIKEVMDSSNVVGFSVAVVKHHKIIYTHSFGLKDIEKNIPLTDNSIFRIASISKSFTATSIMQLVEAGKLSLDDDFSKLVGFR